METTQRKVRKRYLLPLTSIVGIGAVVSLAAWTATTYLSGSFKTASYSSIESSTNGTVWALNSSSPGDNLTVTYPASTLGIAPGLKAAAPLALRVSAGTTGPVSIAISSSVVSGTATGISYELLQVGSFGCTDSTSGTSIVAAGRSVAASGSAPTVTPLVLPAGTLADAGTEVNLCLKVAADSTMVDGSTINVTWQFVGSR